MLNALREVEDALVAYRSDSEERRKLASAVASAADTLYLATNRFQNGLESFLQVLDAQRTLTATRQQLVQADLTSANDVVALSRALGGGWGSPGAESQTPKPDSSTPITPGALDRVVGP